MQIGWGWGLLFAWTDPSRSYIANINNGARWRADARSEFVSQRELHHARVHHTLVFAKRRGRGQRQARVCEVDVIKHVEGLRPELNPLAFPRQLESLCHRHIGVKKGSQPNGSARPRVPWKLVRERVRGTRIRKDAGIPILIDVLPGLDRSRDDRQRA